MAVMVSFALSILLVNLIFRNFKIAIEDTVETGLKPVSTAWCVSGVRKVTKG